MKIIIICIFSVLVSCGHSPKKITQYVKSPEHVDINVEYAICGFQDEKSKDIFKENNLKLTIIDNENYILEATDKKILKLPQRRCLLKITDHNLIRSNDNEHLITCKIFQNYDFIGDHMTVESFTEDNYITAIHNSGELYFFPREFCGYYKTKKKFN